MGTLLAKLAFLALESFLNLTLHTELLVAQYLLHAWIARNTPLLGNELDWITVLVHTACLILLVNILKIYLGSIL